MRSQAQLLHPRLLPSRLLVSHTFHPRLPVTSIIGWLVLWGGSRLGPSCLRAASYKAEGNKTTQEGLQPLCLPLVRRILVMSLSFTAPSSPLHSLAWVLVWRSEGSILWRTAGERLKWEGKSREEMTTSQWERWRWHDQVKGHTEVDA